MAQALALSYWDEEEAGAGEDEDEGMKFDAAKRKGKRKRNISQKARKARRGKKEKKFIFLVASPLLLVVDGREKFNLSYSEPVLSACEAGKNGYRGKFVSSACKKRIGETMKNVSASPPIYPPSQHGGEGGRELQSPLSLHNTVVVVGEDGEALKLCRHLFWSLLPPRLFPNERSEKKKDFRKRRHFSPVT